MIITVSLEEILKTIGFILFIALVIWAKTPPKNNGKE